MSPFSRARHCPSSQDVSVDASQPSESPVRPRRPRIRSSPSHIGDVDIMSDQLAPAPRTGGQAAIQQNTLLSDIAHDVYIARDISLVEADIKAAREENGGMYHGEAARLVAELVETAQQLLNLEKLRTSADESARVTKALEKAIFYEMDLEIGALEHELGAENRDCRRSARVSPLLITLKTLPQRSSRKGMLHSRGRPMRKSASAAD